MKLFKILFILLSLTCFKLSAQVPNEMLFPDKKAEPYEGLDVFYQNFISKLNLNKMNDKDILVLLQFVVDTDGSFTNIHVKKDEFGLGKDIIRTLISMPKWKPASKDGKPIRASYNIPIRIKANKNSQFQEPSNINQTSFETPFFEFNCNCIALDEEIDGSNIKYIYTYGTNVGRYELVVIKANENVYQKYITVQKEYLQSKNIETVKIDYLETVSENFAEVIDQDGTLFYTMNRMFFKDNRVYYLFYMSSDKSDVAIVFNEFLKSFKIKS